MEVGKVFRKNISLALSFLFSDGCQDKISFSSLTWMTTRICMVEIINHSKYLIHSHSI